jgi:hypothetical protein
LVHDSIFSPGATHPPAPVAAHHEQYDKEAASTAAAVVVSMPVTEPSSKLVDAATRRVEAEDASVFPVD